MLNRTMGRCGGTDTPIILGRINERIRTVLRFMKTRGFTSVSSFLVAMCDSWAHNIKHLTGIMLGLWGAFTELVESLPEAGNATALFKLTYDSHMCILARKVMFNKLWTELDWISKHPKLRRPASDFAEVD